MPVSYTHLDVYKRQPYRRSGVTNYYASLYSPLISSLDSPLDRRLALEGLVDQLVELRPRCAVMNFSPLDKDSSDTTNLRQSLSARGWYTKQYDCFGNWYLPCANLRFDDYMESRDSKLYNTWTRKRKRFDHKAPDGARLEICLLYTSRCV